MKVCYFATSTKHVTRNAIIRAGLENNGVQVTNILPPANFKNKLFSISAIVAFCSLFKKAMNEKFDILIVGQAGHVFVFLAKLICFLKRTPLVFDVFVSNYDSAVFDRKKVKAGSIKAKYLHFMDKYTCMMSDLVLLDTSAHIEYFIDEFELARTKFKRVLVGSFPNSYHPTSHNECFTVLFYGTFIPLQGVEYIIRAAKLLENKAFFRIIGDGQMFKECSALSKELKVNNICFEGMKTLDYIMAAISQSDIGLGIFGNTEKARRVIPHKAYSIIACQKPLLTGDSKALRELFTPGKDCIVCNFADEKDLAKKIEDAIENPNLLKSVSQGGYEIYKKYCTLEVIGKDIKRSLMELL